jgi:hypothetical protein
MHALLAASAFLALSTPVQSQPDKHERKAILAALRLPVEAQLGRKVQFVVTRLRKERAWAFVQAEPQRPGGKPIDGRRYFGTNWENMDGLTTTAILRRSGRRWAIIELRIGATDAWYCGHVPVERFDPCSGFPGEK